jgi:hypothetical protein
MRARAGLLLAAAGALLAASGGGSASEVPPVDPEELIRLVVRSQRAVEKRLAGATYDLLEVRTEYAKDGRPKETHRKLYYVLASENGRDPSRELVEVDGRPATPEEVREAAEEEAKRRRGVAERAAKRVSSPPQAGDDDDPLFGERRLSELIGRYDLSVLAEDLEDGLPVYVLTFTPRADAPRKSLGDRALASLEGHVVIDASDFQIRAVDARLTRNLKVAGGLAANVKDLTIAYRSFPLRPHLWFPCAVDLRVTGKAALFFRLDTGFRIEFANLRSFRVETDAVIEGSPLESPR